MKLNLLKLRNKKLFNKYLGLKHYELSYYTFANIFIWKKLFKIWWKITGENLCIFFQNDSGYFMYLPPLGKHLNPKIVKDCFCIMNTLNRNKSVSRIENIEEKNLVFYQNLGYKIFSKDKEYICKTDDLIGLKGDKFKAKRAGYNFFIKNYKYKFLRYKNPMQKQVLNLHKHWQENRRKVSPDNIYQNLLEDSSKYLKVALRYFKQLSLEGYVVKIDNKIEGFTCGFPVNPKMFCVLFEITNLEKKGISSFIFREFTKKLKKYKELNMMDDSGLLNLRKTKLSWKPYKQISSYVASQN